MIKQIDPEWFHFSCASIQTEQIVKVYFYIDEIEPQQGMPKV
jgi:hypothetical protein